MIVAILAGGATAAALIVSANNKHDSRASTFDGQGTASGPATNGNPGTTPTTSAPQDVSQLSRSEIRSEIEAVVTRNIKLVADGSYRQAWDETLSWSTSPGRNRRRRATPIGRKARGTTTSTSARP